MLIALGISLLVVVLVPLIVCIAMWGDMGITMHNMMGSTGSMMGRAGIPWITGGLVVVAFLAGAVLLALGLRRPGTKAPG